MITFSTVVNPEKQSLEVPKQKNSSFIYNVCNNDVVVGRTFGSAFGFIDVYFVHRIARRYKVEDLRRIQKRNLSTDTFVSLGECLIEQKDTP